MKSSQLFIILVVAFSLVLFSNQLLKSSNVELAINCGGDDYLSSSGIKYVKDIYFEGGQTSDFGSNFEIKLSKDKDIYQTERWSNEDFVYNLPVKSQGNHVLILKFSEVYFNSPGEKVFDVQIGNTVVIKDLDIFSRVGKATALDEFIEFEIKNDKLYVNEKSIEGGFDSESNKLVVKFVKKEKDNPKVNAILLVKGTIDDTDYESYKERMGEFEKSKIEKERKQREFQRVSKSIDFEDFEDDFVDDGKMFMQSNGLFSLTSLVITVMISIFTYFIFFKSDKNL